MYYATLTPSRAKERQLQRIKCYVKANPFLLTDCVARQWLDNIRPKLKQSTCSTYGMVYSAHIRPELGHIAVNKLTGRQIESLLAEKAGLTPASVQCLSARTVGNISTVMRGILRFAHANGYINDIPSWTAPTVRHMAKAEVLLKTERNSLQLHLINNLSCENMGILLCLFTGLRLGEICALRWGDISKEHGALYIRRTVQRMYMGVSSRTQVIFDSPKSVSSNRVIPIPVFLKGMLEEMRCGNDDFVLTGGASFVEPRTLQNHFKAILKKCGVREVNFHAIRHTFATDCVEAGFDPKTLSNILGHSDVAVTLNTYVHPSFNSMRRLMDGLKTHLSQSVPFAKEDCSPISCTGEKNTRRKNT